MRKIGIGLAATSLLLALTVGVGQIQIARSAASAEDVKITALGETAFATDDETGVLVENVVGTTLSGDASDAANAMGDVDGDGDITNKDLGLLQRHINGWVVEIDTAAADVDGDGDIDDEDFALLQKYINGWDVTFAPTTTTTTTTTTTVTATSSGDSQTTTTTVTATTTTTTTTQPTQPTVSLPAAGYKPDKCIKVMSVSLSGNTVTMEIRNTSRVWETEDEKSYFEYTCYGESGDVLLVDKLMFGYIPTLTTKTYTFDIPEGTVKVVLTDFNAEYWSVPV